MIIYSYQTCLTYKRSINVYTKSVERLLSLAAKSECFSIFDVNDEHFVDSMSLPIQTDAGRERALSDNIILDEKYHIDASCLCKMKTPIDSFLNLVSYTS